MMRSTTRMLCASILAMLCIDTAAAQTYYARTRINPLKKSGAVSAPAPTKSCGPGDPSAWSYLIPPGSRNGYYGDPLTLTKVGSAPDRSPELQRICERAIAGSSRTQCQIQGQGGFPVDVLISKMDGTVPVETIERDNAIVYEVLVCS
jgi:hypothetical protein